MGREHILPVYHAGRSFVNGVSMLMFLFVFEHGCFLLLQFFQQSEVRGFILDFVMRRRLEARREARG